MHTLLLAQSEEWGSARWIGAVVIPIGLTIVILKCYLISRRDTTSSKCLTSLMLVLIGLLLASVVGVAGRLGISDLYGIGFATLGSGLAIIAGGITAIVGLVDYRRTRPPYRQGRNQAVAALLIAGAMIAYGVSQGLELAKDTIGVADAGPQVIKEHNFRFDAPPDGWRKLNPSTLKEEASLAYFQIIPPVWFMVIAETTGTESALTSADLAEVAKQNLLDVAPDAQCSRPAEFRHDGMQGVRFKTYADVEGQEFRYVHQMFLHNGYSYQLIAWGMRMNADDVERGARQMLRCFHLIDPSSVVYGEGATGVTQHASERLGYRIVLPGEGWFTSEELRAAYTHADLVVQHGPARWLSVNAVLLADDTVADEAVLKGLLSLKDIDYRSETLLDKKTAEVDGRHEITFGYQYEVDDTGYHARYRVVRVHGMAYLIQVERERDSLSQIEFMADALASVAFEKPAAPLDAAGLTARERITHAQYYNAVGIHYHSEKGYAGSYKWFARAMRLDPEDAAYVENAVDALANVDRHDDALALLLERRESITEELSLRGDLAWLLSIDGKDEQALREYAEAFAKGLRDADDLEFYAGLLMDAERADEALDVISNYRKKKDAPDLVVIHARMLRRAKKPEEARGLLEAQPAPRTSGADGVLAEIYEELKQYDRALAIVQSLLDQGYDGVWSYRTMARIQITMKAYDKALKTTAEGLEKHGGDEPLLELAATARNAK